MKIERHADPRVQLKDLAHGQVCEDIETGYIMMVMRPEKALDKGVNKDRPLCDLETGELRYYPPDAFLDHLDKATLTV